jgi:alpha-tubulin suppressor-like RCC1 family protein
MRNANRCFGLLLWLAALCGCGAANAATAAISAGGLHTIGLKTDGTVLSWGSDANGQLGIGRLTQSSNPILSSGISGVTAISAGEWHTVALKADGGVWAWGRNDFSQLGDGTTASRSTARVKVVVAWFMQPTVAYRYPPNASL